MPLKQLVKQRNSMKMLASSWQRSPLEQLTEQQNSMKMSASS